MSDYHPNLDGPAEPHALSIDGDGNPLSVPPPCSASRTPDGSVICDACGNECEWGECHAGCEDGYFDGYEEDPMWYDEGDLVPCNECRGQGGSYWCETKDCPTGEIRKIKRLPNAELSDAKRSDQ